jgi:Domain of unknown function (DUF4188)
MTAEIEGDFVVFLIGMRINRPLKPCGVGSDGDVGIWHESYLVPADSYDAIYNNMPPIGLGEATKLAPAAGRKATAAGRAGIREEGYPAGAPTDRIDV